MRRTHLAQRPWNLGVSNSILFIVTRHSFLKKVTQTATRIHVTTQRITVREDGGGKDVELAPIQSPTSPSTKSPYFMDSPFVATLDTQEKSYASSLGSDSEDADKKGGIYVSVIE